MTISEGNTIIDNWMGVPHSTPIPYDTHWDYLMPVVERIEKVGYNVNILRTDCSVYSDEFKNTNMGQRFRIQSETKKHAVWLAVIRFIQNQM